MGRAPLKLQRRECTPFPLLTFLFQECTAREGAQGAQVQTFKQCYLIQINFSLRANQEYWKASETLCTLLCETYAISLRCVVRRYPEKPTFSRAFCSAPLLSQTQTLTSSTLRSPHPAMNCVMLSPQVQQVFQRQPLKAATTQNSLRTTRCFTSRCPPRILRASAEPDQAAKLQAVQEAMKNPEVGLGSL